VIAACVAGFLLGGGLLRAAVSSSRNRRLSRPDGDPAWSAEVET
jgi:hypothetical protein